MNTQSLGSKSGFTLVEVMVVLVIAALLASLFLPELRQAIFSSERSSAVSLQNEIQSTYDKWSTLGGSHPSSGSTALTFALLEHLASEPSTAQDPTPFYKAVAGDPQAIREQRRTDPLPGTIRTRMPAGAPILETVEGSEEVVYASKFIIRFAPSSNRTGSWTVSLLP